MHATVLFLYGTLKRGMSNHHRVAGEFLGEARTRPLYRLYALGWHPGLVGPVEDGGVAIAGELWRVGEDVLAQLDEFEGVPTWFERRPVAVEGWDESVEAYFYVGKVPDGAATGDRWPIGGVG